MARLSFIEAKSYLETNGYRVRKSYNLYNIICLEDGDYSQFGKTGYEVVRFAKSLGCQSTVCTLDPITFTDRTFGIEIETVHKTNRNIREVAARALTNAGIPCEFLGYTHTVMSTWKIVTDSSLSGGTGLEVVSPILKGQEGLDEIAKVMSILEELGCSVNRTTGCHVHINMNNDATKVNNVFDFYKKNERLFDSLMPQSRRGNNNTFCRSLSGYSASTWKSRTRYVKLNYMSFVKYGTIEFRQHSGTLNGDKISHWIKLVQAVVEYSVSGRQIKSYNSLEEMLSDLNINDTWYAERAMDLAC